MTPAEANHTRREAALGRARRIDALDPGQLANFIHRMAAIVPADVDRVLDEFDANAPKPRAEKQLHPVTIYSADPESPELPDGGGFIMYCRLCPDYHQHIHDGQGLPDLNQLAARHSGIVP